MNVPLILLAGWLVLIVLLAGALFRKSHRVGYLEGRLAQYEDDDDDGGIALEAMIRSGIVAPTSMVSPFAIASHAEIFDPPASDLAAAGRPFDDTPPPWPGWPGTGIGDMSILPNVSKCPRCDLELGDTPLGEHLLGEECQRRTGDAS